MSSQARRIAKVKPRLGLHDLSLAHLCRTIITEDAPPVRLWAGGHPLTIFACTIPTEGAPSFFLQGCAAMLRVLFDFVVDT